METSSSSSGSVKQRLHFGEVIPILHCNCGNELTLQTSLRYCYFVMWVEKASEDKASGYKNIQNKVYYVVQVQIQREYQ